MASWLPIISKMPFACPHFQTFKTEEEVLELTLLALSLSLCVYMYCDVMYYHEMIYTYKRIQQNIAQCSTIL